MVAITLLFVTTDFTVSTKVSHSRRCYNYQRVSSLAVVGDVVDACLSV